MALSSRTQIHMDKVLIGLVLLGRFSLTTAFASRVGFSSPLTGDADSQDLAARVHGCSTVRATGVLLLH